MSYTLRQNINLALQSMGIDSLFIIKETFLGYKYRKQERLLSVADKDIPTKLITIYYGLNDERIAFNTLKKAFITHYINQESKLEGVDVKSKHSKAEVDGLRLMYEYINSEEIDKYFSIYTLKDLHKVLYSQTPYPEFAGKTRRDDRYLPGTGTDLCPWWAIDQKLYEISPEVDRLKALAPTIRENGEPSEILRFIDDVVKLKCALILIHPFSDGNGRCIRAFTNKLLEDAGLPPIYVKESERLEYHKAMNLANNEGDFTEINNFYRYKICDSIIELDINQRIKDDRDQNKEKTIGTLN